MARTLAWVAGGGLSVGVVCLSLAYAIGGNELRHMADFDLPFGGSCGKEGEAKSERRLAWNGGDTINIALPATVRYRGGEGSEVIVRGSSGVVDRVDLQGHSLTLNCRGFARAHDIEVILPGRTFRRINLTGSGTVIMENVSQSELAVSISGSGDIRAQGKVDNVKVSIAGSGHARLADLATRQLTVKIAGSGNVEAAPTDLADIRLTGSGNVRLLTRPAQLRSHISGMGRITQASLDSAEGRK